MANNAKTHGFISASFALGELITTIGAEKIYDAVRDSANFHTEKMNEMLDVLAAQTTNHQFIYEIPGTGSLQPGTPSSQPEPDRHMGKYTVSLPMHFGMTSWGGDEVANSNMTAQQADEQSFDKQSADARSVKKHLLSAALYSASYSYTDPEFGSLTVYPFANNDAVVYLGNNGEVAAKNHYLAQAADIDDSNNPFPTIKSTLRYHPCNAQASLVAFVASNLVDNGSGSINGELTNFVPFGDPNVTLGAGADSLTPRNWNEIRAFGDEIIGYVDGVYIVESRQMPTDYMFVLAVGGRNGEFSTPMARREYAAANLQGLQVRKASIGTNGARYDYYRRCGIGVVNRAAGLCYQIGNASYQNPSGYDPSKGLY